MLKIFFLLIAIFLPQLVLSAEQKTVPTMEEINADLEAKKVELEPFDPKKVKIDLESLGLDDVEKKAEEKDLPPLPLSTKVADKKNEKTIPLDAKPEKVKEEVKGESLMPEQADVMSKIQKFLSFKKNSNASNKKESKSELVANASGSDVKKSTEQYVNSNKKKNLKRRLELEKNKKWDEKKEKEKSKKLHELRKKYIEEAEINEKIPDQQDEDFEISGKILPQKKDLNHFLSEEQQPLPILQRYRSSEDLHIPIILTTKERIDVLFNTVSIGSVSAFNEDYKDIQNPNVHNEQGDTILTYALLLKRYPIIASILSKGANPNLPNKLGYNPLSIAIELLDFKSFELLANNKADLNYIDAFGRTYLMHAARVGFLSGLDLLVSRGVDINAIDNDGFTALAIAYRHKQEIIVQYLLKHGAKTWVEKPYDPEQQSLILELEDRWKKQ